MAMMLLSILILVFLLYSILILFYYQGWRQIADYTPPQISPSVKISVIIPARNEEKNIGKLLQALECQTYPKQLYESIVIDDHSTDKTGEIVSRYDSKNIRLINLQTGPLNSYKKKAIETGIDVANGDLIVTTDADCIPPPGWLEIIAKFYEENKPVFIAGPVRLQSDSSLLQTFQAIDFMILQGITAASVNNKFHSMCNGANLAYLRKVFHEVDGFTGIDQIASGDDMLLMHKIVKKYPDKIFYLKSKPSIVTTEPMLTWLDFFNQRIRWASKAGHYEDKRLFWALFLVYLLNLLFFIFLVLGFWDHQFWFYAAGLWIAKTLIEFPFVHAIVSFFNARSLTKYFFLLQPLHMFYIVIAGFLGVFGTYEWKGRKVK